MSGIRAAQPLVDTPERAARDLDLYWRRWLAEQRLDEIDAWQRAEDRYRLLTAARDAHRLEVSRRGR